MAKIINGSAIYNALANYLATNAYLNDTAQDVLCMVAKWIDEAPEVDTPKWIPVTERLPDTFGEYIVAVKDVSGEMYSDYADFNLFQQRWTTGLFLGVRDKVTHWMPLPEPPKEVE